MDVSQPYGSMIGTFCFSIRESMEGLFYTRGRYKQAFSPPFIVNPENPSPFVWNPCCH